MMAWTQKIKSVKDLTNFYLGHFLKDNLELIL